MTKAKPIKILPSVERLQECFIYAPDTGELRWRIRPREHFITQGAWATWNSKNAGKRAGMIHEDKRHHRISRHVRIDGIRYWEHRVIFKMMTGIEPGNNLDHADGNASNNVWSNIRTANHFEQGWNRKLRYDNKFGYRGIFPIRNRWQAKIFIYGKNKHLGMFDTPEEAGAAYEAEARRLHGEFYWGLHHEN